MKSVEIFQITPADGWRAVYAREDTQAESIDSACVVVHLVCFAAVTDWETNEFEIVGMIPEGTDVVPCVSPTFVGYLANGRPLHEMQEQFDAWRVAQAEETRRIRLEQEIREEQTKPPESDPAN